MSINPETTVRKIVSIPRKMAGEIDEVRHGRRMKSESAAIRMLLQRGLEAEREVAAGDDAR